MRLESAHIKNYRSLKDVTVSFEPTCRVLVGINESGKSNVLSALSLLSDESAPDRKRDVREALKGEREITASSVEFIFGFDKVDLDEIIAAVRDTMYCSSDDPSIVLVGGKRMKLGRYLRERSSALYCVDVLAEKKQAKYYTFPTAHKLVEGWVKPVSPPPGAASVTFQDDSGTVHRLSDYKILRTSDIPENVPDAAVVEAELKDLQTAYGVAALGTLRARMPKVLFWEYDEDGLLPDAVDINTFASNPDSCLPLKKMFHLAKVTGIKEKLEEVRKGTDNRVQNFLDRIADQATRHFRSVWPEYRDVKFSLRLNADKIAPGVKEQNFHDFAIRSDGFKRFITFLLMVSVDVKTKSMANTLLLIDEPDFSLHPSGARYLRDELIRISGTNYVVYSTHSIFMIDSANIRRHYIVKKKKEVTDIVEAKESNVADEEVLYNALGHSVFSVLGERNIIFEGWKDKRLFSIALEGAKAAVKRKFAKVGICHSKGASGIRAITPMLELGKRECVIVSDSDRPALEEQRRYRTWKGYGTWYTYQEIDKSIGAVTGEDFIKKASIVRAVNRRMNGRGLPTFTLGDLPADREKLKAIGGWLENNGMSRDEARVALVGIKDEVFGRLTRADIEDEYLKLLEGLKV